MQFHAKRLSPRFRRHQDATQKGYRNVEPSDNTHDGSPLCIGAYQVGNDRFVRNVRFVWIPRPILVYRLKRQRTVARRFGCRLGEMRKLLRWYRESASGNRHKRVGLFVLPATPRFPRTAGRPPAKYFQRVQPKSIAMKGTGPRCPRTVIGGVVSVPGQPASVAIVPRLSDRMQ